MTSKTTYTVFFSLTLIILIGALAAALFWNRSAVNQAVNQIPTTPKPALDLNAIERQQPAQAVYKYETAFSDQTFDAKVTNQTTGEIVIPSIVKLCGIFTDLLQSTPKKDTDSAAQLTKEGIFYTQRTVPDTDNPHENLIRITANPVSCKQMASGIYITGFTDRQISPNGTKLTVVNEATPRILTVITLKSDSAKSAVQLQAGETLNGGSGGLSNDFRIKWLNDTTIQYSIFQDTKTSTGKNPFLRLATVTVQ